MDVVGIIIIFKMMTAVICDLFGGGKLALICHQRAIRKHFFTYFLIWALYLFNDLFKEYFHNFKLSFDEIYFWCSLTASSPVLTDYS